MGIFDFFKGKNESSKQGKKNNDLPSNEIKKTFYESGNLKNQSSYTNDLKHGEELNYHENGKLKFKTDWVNGIQQGLVISYDEDGNKIKKSNILNGDFEGEQIEWYLNGKIKAERIYEKDKIISEKNYNIDGILRILDSDMEDVGIVTNFNGKPYNGLAFYRTSDGVTEYMLKEGLKNGFMSYYDENENLYLRINYDTDIPTGEMELFHDGKNILKDKFCLPSDTINYEVKVKEELYYFKEELYSGFIYYPQNFTIYEIIKGVKTNCYYSNGNKKEVLNIETNEKKEFYLNGQLSRHTYRVDKNIEKEETFFDNGNVKSINLKNLENYRVIERKRYYNNGNIELIELRDTSDNFTEKKHYYESGKIRIELKKDKKFGDITYKYYENGKTSDIWIEDLIFTFDEKGNEDTERFEDELKKDSIYRKHLKLDEFSGQIKTKPDEREILVHEIMTKGHFSFTSEDGSTISVSGQRHTLVSISQIWDDEYEEWEEQDREEIEDFHLTHYEEGYKYHEEHLIDFFELDEEDNYPDWDYNGFSENWSGIEDEDSNEIRQKKWDDYKNKFPIVTSKDKFRID